MNKRILCFIISLIAIVSMAVQGFGTELKIVYNAREDFTSTQGANLWRYQYMTAAENYESYTDMTWKGTKYVYVNANGDIVNNVNSTVLQPGPWGKNSAYVWIAPYSGTVKLTCEGNVRKQNVGSDTTALITKTNEVCKEPTVLWEKAIAGSDKTGAGNTYDINLEIKANERLYFEIKASSNASAETAWTPIVTYTQTAAFEQNGEKILKASDLIDGADLTCTLYDKNAITENANIYAAVFDSEGYMRAISDEQLVDVVSWTNRKAEMTIPMNFGAESYDGWQVKIFAVSAQSGRRYPFNISELINIK